MKKLFLVIATLTLLLSRSSILVSARTTTFTCKYDGGVDVCNLKPGQENACSGISSTQLRTLCYEAPCSAGDHNDESVLNCPSAVPNPPPPSQDCTSLGGQCRLQSYGCFTPEEKGTASQQCRALSSSANGYMCCIPNPEASTPPGSSPPPIDPGGYNSFASSQCVGRALADYMNAVIAGAGNIPNVKLLSPAFNMTSSTFDDIVNSIGAAGGNFDGLDGIAGNAYNVENRRVTSWLTEKLKNPYVSGKPFYLTETGEKDFADGKIKSVDEAITRLKPELDALRTFGNPWNAQAALLFNGLGTNSNFSTFQWSVDNLKLLCGSSNCGTVGINQASFFSQSDTIYSIMRDLSMLFDLEIATSGSLDAVIRAVDALPNGNVIVRVGVGDDSGGFSDPQKYVDFIKAVADRTDKTVYFIAGPNEPDSEFWADPQCKINQLPAKKGPLEEGFRPTRYNCSDTADPEYNPLRPYPGSPCDLLIPRSVPEAPLTSEKKFNTFACGASLTPQREEVFDPYGKNGSYESINPGPENYAHTVCYPSEFGTSDQEKKDYENMRRTGGSVTCWRSSAFDVTVDLSHANLGVLSNTQDTSLTDAQKVNEYLSWYLTGTPQIGDQLPIDSNNPADISRVVNYSGPLRKLMPFDLQNIAKSTIVKSANIDVHNYIVGCKKDVDFTYVLNAIKAWFETLKSSAGLILTVVTTMPRLPFDLYDFITTFSDATAQLIPILQSFTLGDAPKILAILTPLGKTDLANDLAKLGEVRSDYLHDLGNLFNSLNLDMAESCQTSQEFIRLKEQLLVKGYRPYPYPVGDLPPDPSAYTSFGEYWKKYNNWRGLTNVIFFGATNIPNPFVNESVWAQLFQNVPFSSMEDTAGEYTMSVFRDSANDQQVEGLGDQKYSTVVNKNTAPLQLIIKSANLAK